MLRLMQNLAVTASVVVLMGLPASASGTVDGSSRALRDLPPLIVLAQAAGPTTAGGTQPYISAPDSAPPADAKPVDPLIAPPAKLQSTAEPAASDSPRKPELAEPAAPVKRLIDPATVKKPVAETPAPKNTPDTAAVAKPIEPAPAPAATPAKPDVTEAAPKNEAPKPAVAESKPEPAADEVKDKKRRKSSAVATNKHVPTERRVRERPVYAEEEVVTRTPRGYYIPSPIPPRGIGPSGQREYADNRPVIVVRRAPVACHTYVYPGLFFQHREVRCP